MNNLTTSLLGSVALVALAAAPASAGTKGHHAFRVSAMHAGNTVNKTKIHNQGATHVTYTFGAYSYISASSGKTNVASTYYKFNSNGSICSTPKMKITAAKKSTYAKIGTSSETYSEGCASGPTTFLGDTYTNKTGVTGNVDSFVSTLTAKFKNGSTKYKGTLNLDVTVTLT